MSECGPGVLVLLPVMGKREGSAACHASMEQSQARFVDGWKFIQSLALIGLAFVAWIAAKIRKEEF